MDKGGAFDEPRAEAGGRHRAASVTEGGLAPETLAALRAENARLRVALAEARREAGRAPDVHAELSVSRAETASARRETREARIEAALEQQAHRQAIADAASDLEASQDLVAALRASRTALAKSEERLSFAFAASGSLGWWDWDIPGDRLYASERFALMFGIDPTVAAAGAPASAYLGGVHPEDRDRIGDRVRAATERGGDFSEEYRLLTDSGRTTWIHARGRCYHDAAGQPVRFPGVALDITERKAADLRKDALVELGDALRDLDDVGRIGQTAAAILARALGAARAGYGTVDPDGETVVIHPDWCAPGVPSIAGPHQFRDYGSFVEELKRGEAVTIDALAPDGRAIPAALLALRIRFLVNVPILARGRLAAVVFVHHDRPHAATPVEMAFLRTVADRAQAAVARIQAEEQQEVLNSELSHRLKNTLALVQSIVGQTLRSAPDVGTAREALSLRLIALGKAHDILLAAGHEAADVAEMVRGALALLADAPERFQVAGPPVRVGPSAALSLALVLHELATNAAKYGALSMPGGRVSVAWAVEAVDDTPRFRLDWTESGGPPVRPPTRKGFGSRLIERGLAGGRVRIAYRPEGLTCSFTAPLDGFGAEG